MSDSLRVLAPEELELVAGGSIGDNWWDPNYGIAPGSAYSGMGLNVPVFSATSWTTSSFGNNYDNYSTWAANANYSSSNAFLMANPYTYTPPAGQTTVPIVKFVDSSNNDFNSQNGTMADGVYKSQNPTTGFTEIVVKADLNEIVVTASYLEDPSWANFSMMTGIYGLGGDALSLASLTSALADLQEWAKTHAVNISEDGLDFIFEAEMQAGVSNDLHHPSSASGVTIGAGYDMKGRTSAEVQADLIKVGVPAATAAILAGGATLTGSAAANFVNQNSGLVNLTDQQQYALGRIAVVPYVTAVQNAFANWDLNQNQFDALVSFSYNLGANIFTATSSTSLRNAIAAESFTALTNAMQLYVYSGTTYMQGLADRRAEEVALFNTPVT